MFSEYVTLGESLLISLFCIIVVFLILLAISYIVDLTRVLVVRKQKKDLGLDASTIGIIGSPDGSTAVISANANNEIEDDTELVAVITAAIAAMTGTDASGLVIRNIKKVSDADTTWSRVGRMELMR